MINIKAIKNIVLKKYFSKILIQGDTEHQ